MSHPEPSLRAAARRRGNPDLADGGAEPGITTATAAQSRTATPAARLQRNDGRLVLGIGGRAGAAHLADLYQRPPLRALFPRPEPGDPFTAALVNTAGGVASGDLLATEIAVAEGAAALVSAQAAEKVYRSDGDDSRLTTRLQVGAGATLEWAPQETILFDGARLRREIAVDAAPTARVLATEMVVLGRIARGERLTRGRVHDAWRVRRGGRLVWAETLRRDGDIPALVDHPATLDGAAALATVCYVADGAAALVDAARSALADPDLAGSDLIDLDLTDNGCRSGATAVRADVLLVRLVGRDAGAVRRQLAAVWSALRAAALGRPPRPPRLWTV